MTIEVSNETDTAVDAKALSDLARHVLGTLRIHPLAELAVLLVDAPAMEQLHIQWMDESGPTDVLSFPMDELRPTPAGADPEPGVLGDIVLCPSVAADQARTAGHSTVEELHLLTVHGILHLLGYDHAEPEDERVMFDLQRRLLEEWRMRA